jgi:hypothetical protein
MKSHTVILGAPLRLVMDGRLALTLAGHDGF